jgi:hypothetical protein
MVEKWNSSQSEVIFPNPYLNNLEFFEFSEEMHSALNTPQMVLSVAQWCIIPYQGIALPSFSSYFYKAYVEFWVWEGCSILTLHKLSSQILDPLERSVILLDQDVHVCAYI